MKNQTETLKKAGGTKRNLSIGKAFHVIEVMASQGGPMRLQEIAQGTGMPASTVLRFLSTLKEYGYVDQVRETSQYFLTMKFCRIGNQVSKQVRIRDIVRPYLERLSREFEESVSLAIEQNFHVVYVDVVDGPDHMLQTLQRIGKIAPLHGTGVGKCLLLGFDEFRLEELVRRQGLPALTPNTIHSLEALKAELETVKRQGWAIDNEECEIGARCVAAPIRDYSGRIVAAISTSGPVFRMTREKMEYMKIRITQAAEEISQLLGYEKETP
ncbi:MAG: IclR family transcriptional regulator [Spirochaetes bacterium]|nr:IclR family transcriptional regulator [Spirochaetota bacterium]